MVEIFLFFETRNRQNVQTLGNILNLIKNFEQKIFHFFWQIMKRIFDQCSEIYELKKTLKYFRRRKNSRFDFKIIQENFLSNWSIKKKMLFQSSNEKGKYKK